MIYRYSCKLLVYIHIHKLNISRVNNQKIIPAGVSEVTGFVNSRYNDPHEDNPDLQLFFGGFLANCARTGQVGERLDNNSRSIQIIPTVLRPKSRGVLKLRNKHPLSHPMIFANYLTHPDDVKTLIEGIKIALRMANTTGEYSGKDGLLNRASCNGHYYLWREHSTTRTIIQRR